MGMVFPLAIQQGIQQLTHFGSCRTVVLLRGGWKENYNIVKIALRYNAKINLGQDKVKDLPD